MRKNTYTANRRQREFVADDEPVAESDDAIGMIGEFAVVRDQHERGLVLAVKVDEQLENVFAVFTIEVAGRFVGHQQRRPGDEGASEGNALLFAAGQLDGIVVSAIAEADAIQQFQSAFAVGAFAAEFGGQQHVFFSSERGHELIRLKNEADFASAQARQCVFFQIADFDAVELDAARGHGVEAGQQTEQRALPAAGCTHDGNELGLRHAEGEAFENIDAG